MTVQPSLPQIIFCIIGFGLLVSILVHAAGIKIDTVDIKQTNTHYTLNAKLNCDLSEDAIEALHHGVPLNFLVDIKSQIVRDYWWNKTLNHSTIHYKLEYHPLSERYVLTELNRSLKEDFQYLGSAMKAIGDIQNWPILNISEREPEQDYEIKVRAKLDLQSLPAPMRLLAFVSRSWRLSSGWQTWKLAE